jgi:hypothetical protein
VLAAPWRGREEGREAGQAPWWSAREGESATGKRERVMFAAVCNACGNARRGDRLHFAARDAAMAGA